MSESQYKIIYHQQLNNLSICLEVKKYLHSTFPADSTGTHSLYTTYQGYEVMFHVSTMLPYMPNNPQQVRASDHSKLRCEKLSNTSILKKSLVTCCVSKSDWKSRPLFSFFFFFYSLCFACPGLSVLPHQLLLLCSLCLPFFWWIGAGWGSVVQSFFYLKNLTNIPVLHILLCACTMTCL